MGGGGWGLLLSGGRNFHKGSAINLKNYSTIAELFTVARSHIILLWGPLLSEFSQVHYKELLGVGCLIILRQVGPTP